MHQSKSTKIVCTLQNWINSVKDLAMNFHQTFTSVRRKMIFCSQGANTFLIALVSIIHFKQQLLDLRGCSLITSRKGGGRVNNECQNVNKLFSHLFKFLKHRNHKCGWHNIFNVESAANSIKFFANRECPFCTKKRQCRLKSWFRTKIINFSILNQIIFSSLELIRICVSVWCNIWNIKI